MNSVEGGFVPAEQKIMKEKIAPQGPEYSNAPPKEEDVDPTFGYYDADEADQPKEVEATNREVEPDEARLPPLTDRERIQLNRPEKNV